MRVISLPGTVVVMAVTTLVAQGGAAGPGLLADARTAQGGAAEVAAAGPWCAVPLAEWVASPTTDPCTEAMTPEGRETPAPPPAPPFGEWKEEGGGLLARGLANCWSTRLLPGERQEVGVTTRFTVLKSSGMARQLPGGCMRWGFRWGENLPGWDVGVVLGYQGPLSFYRLQLSAARGELALWDADGGFLQLIPCPVELGRPHDLTVRWQGARLSADLDGKTVMDYWDRSLPRLRGRVGLAVWKSEVRFDRFGAVKLDAPASSPPPHVPAFRLEPSGNLLQGHPAFTVKPYSGVIVFDGYEPICHFVQLVAEEDDNYSANSLLQEAVKLKPGWRAAYYTFIGPNGLNGGWRWPLLVGRLPEAFSVRESGPRLVFTFATETPGKGRTDYTCTVTFSPERGMYRYEYSGTLKTVAETRPNEFELFDPLTYNNRAPGPEVIRGWNPAGHRWLVYQGASGAWERMPLTDYPNDYNTDINNGKTQWGRVQDFLYPDPAACPLFESELKWPQVAPFSVGQCAWGYDYHHREMLGRAVLPAGTERSFTMVFTALPPDEAGALFARSNLMPCIVDEKRPIHPFVPTGTSFAEATGWQNPSATMAWIGGTRDETTGHGDAFSLRLDAPGKASVRVYHYMIEPHAKRFWVRGWVKTQDLEGPGLKLRAGYFSPPPPVKDTFLLGTGTREWTYFSVVTEVFNYRDVTDLIFDTTGCTGRAWIDGIAVSALPEDQRPETTGTPTGE